jgi:hypothetical protein
MLQAELAGSLLIVGRLLLGIIKRHGEERAAEYQPEA